MKITVISLKVGSVFRNGKNYSTKKSPYPSAHLFSRVRQGVLYLLQGRYRDSTDQLLKEMELAEILDMLYLQTGN